MVNKFILFLDKYKKWILFFCTILIFGATVYGYRKGIFTDQEKMSALLDKSGVLAPLVFIILQAVQVVIPILPGAVGCLYGVIIFGSLKGFIYNYIGICIGSVLAFLLARHLGRDFVQNVTGGKFYKKYSKYLINENRFEKIFSLLIFLPVSPDDFLCYLAGVSKMSLEKFTTIILLGKPLAILLYSMGLNQIFRFAINLVA